MESFIKSFSVLKRMGIAELYIRSIGHKLLEDLTLGKHARVYKAEHRGELEIVKFPNPSPTFFEQGNRQVPSSYGDRVRHVNTETQILDLVQGIDGIAQKKGTFPLPLFPDLIPKCDQIEDFQDVMEFFRYGILDALVKEYIDGRMMEYEEKITDKGNQEVIVKAVAECHDRGIASLNLIRENIILSETGKPHIVDLGTAEVEAEYTGTFERCKMFDYLRLRDILDTPDYFGVPRVPSR